MVTAVRRESGCERGGCAVILCKVSRTIRNPKRACCHSELPEFQRDVKYATSIIFLTDSRSALSSTACYHGRTVL